MSQLISPSSIRAKFNQPAGVVIQEYANITDKQRREVLDFQAKLVAFKESYPEKDAYKIKDADEAQGYIDASPITKERLAEIRKHVESQQGAPAGVPVYGDLAVKLGFVHPSIKDSLILAQAAERTVQASEAVANNIIKDGFTKQDASAPMFTRSFIGKGSPVELTQAQAINHLGDLIAGFIAMKGGKDNVSDKVQAAQSTLLGLGINLYEKANGQLDNTNVKKAADAIKTVVGDLKGKYQGQFDFDRSMSILKEGLEDVKSSFKDTAFGTALENIINLRLQQVGLQESKDLTQGQVRGQS